MPESSDRKPMTDANDSDDSEYRPTDWLAICELSYGRGAHKDTAVMNALRYAGPWDLDDRDDPVEVVVWELYADSWQSHNLSGPERGAEQLSFRRYAIPVEEAQEASIKATDANTALSRALGEAETVEQIDGTEE